MSYMLRRQLKTGFAYVWESAKWIKCPIISTMALNEEYDNLESDDEFDPLTVPDDDEEYYDEDYDEDFDPDEFS